MSKPWIGWIETQNGTFHLDAPVFRACDIAHALGQIARFNGHGKFFYSVAEHSLLVAAIMEELDIGDPFEGLMHDATEAYLSDVPSPFKEGLPDWRARDAVLTAEMRRAYKLPPLMTEECKVADTLALFIEAHELMPSRGRLEHWASPEALELQPQADWLREEMGVGLDAWGPLRATAEFQNKFNELQAQKRHAQSA